MCGRNFSKGLFLTQPSQWRLDQVTMWGLLDNKTNGMGGISPIYVLILVVFKEFRVEFVG